VNQRFAIRFIAAFGAAIRLVALRIRHDQIVIEALMAQLVRRHDILSFSAPVRAQLFAHVLRGLVLAFADLNRIPIVDIVYEQLARGPQKLRVD
jgi:hypothetical protein